MPFETGAPAPPFDVEASQMNLPGLFGITLASVPPPAGLAVPANARSKAARPLGPRGPGALRVDIVWSGRVTVADNARRTVGLAGFLRFAEVPGVRLYRLQKGPSEEELAGALGTPVWNLVRHVPHWIDGISGGHPLWCPTMHLFRQGCDLDWAALVAPVRHAFRPLARHHS